MTLKPNPTADVLYDDQGRPYVPLRPSEDTVNVPMTPPELLELWRLHAHAASVWSQRGNAVLWKYHEVRAAGLLKTLGDLDPFMAKWTQPPHYGVEGKG